MEKILIIGCPGAGKTTFANSLGAALHIPVHHLDKHFWKEGRKPTPQGEFRRIQNGSMREDRWILDGNFTKSIDNRIAGADTIIVFDFPRVINLWRTLKRFFQYVGSVRPDMGGGNKEALKWMHIKFIITFPRKEFLAKALLFSRDKKVIVLHSPNEASQFLERVGV